MSEDIKVKIDDDGIASFNIFHLLHLLPEERLPEIIESLSCAETIIQHVCNQVVHGCTENGYSGTWCTNYNTALQKARRAVAEGSGDVAKTEINSLEVDLRRTKALAEEYIEKYYDLHHKNMDRGIR